MAVVPIYNEDGPKGPVTMNTTAEQTSPLSSTCSILQLEDLSAFLAEKGLEPWTETDGEWIYVACRVGGEDVQLAVTIEAKLLHLQLLLPTLSVSASAVAATSVSICRINDSLRLPGFCLDDESRTISFRVSMLMEPSGISSDTLTELLATCILTVKTHWQTLAEVVKNMQYSTDSYLHDPHPSFARNLSVRDRYSDVLAYLTEKHPSPKDVNNGPNIDQLSHLDLLLNAGCAVIWNPANAEVLGAIQKSKLSLFNNGEWQFIEEETFRQRLHKHGNPVQAAFCTDYSQQPFEHMLEKIGFRRSYEEVVVERSLENRLPPADSRFSLHAESIPPRDLLKLAMQDSKNRALHDLDVDYLIQLTSTSRPMARATNVWYSAQFNGQTVGLVCLWVSNEQSCGGIEFIGVLPEFRGQGLGRGIHSLVLQKLAQLGCLHYRDATDVLNLPMQRVFFWHGCCVVAVLRQFRMSL